MPPSSSLSSPTVSESMGEASHEYDEHTIVSRNYSGDDPALPPLGGAGETRKVQPEEVAIVSFILGWVQYSDLSPQLFAAQFKWVPSQSTPIKALYSLICILKMTDPVMVKQVVNE